MILRPWNALVMILGMNLELDGVNAGRGGGGEVSVADDGVVCPSAVDGLPLELHVNRYVLKKLQHE